MSLRTAAGVGARQWVETLENRTLLAVSLGSDGWTHFAPSSDTRTIYVSSSTGSDSNNGTSSSSPLRTIAKAKSFLRDGRPDWLLLKRGDTFTEPIGRWMTSGRSTSEPQVISAYGTGNRPLIRSGTSEGFVTYGGNPVNNIAITGVHFVAHTYTGTNGGLQTSGIRLLRQGSGYHIEDVMVQGYKENIVLYGDGSGVQSVKMRRNIIVDAYASTSIGNAHGIYIGGMNRDVTIEQNILDHNGWKKDAFGPTIYNHSIYAMPGSKGIVVRGNIIARASMTGIQMRSGGIVEGNVFVRNPLGVLAAGGDSRISDNVFIEGTDIGSQPSGVAVDAVNLPSLVLRNNIIANDASPTGTGVTGIKLQHSINNADISGNIIYNWRRGLRNGGGSNITVARNQFQDPGNQHFLVDHPSNGGTRYTGNTYSSGRSKPFRMQSSERTFTQWKTSPEPDAVDKNLAYTDPRRSLASYNASIGGSASLDSFLSAARTLSRQTWKSSLTASSVIAYIRAGFGTETPTSPNASPTGVTLAAKADANVRDGSHASTNFGTSSGLYVRKGNSGENQIAYLRFDLSAVTTLTSAKLRLFGRLNTTTSSSVATAIFGADATSWTEGGLNWNNRPRAATSALATTTVTNAAAKGYEWDLTSYLKQQKAAGKNEVTLMIQTTANSPSVIFNSRESSSSKPQLVIT
jgi:hypothetical protein